MDEVNAIELCPFVYDIHPYIRSIFLDGFFHRHHPVLAFLPAPAVDKQDVATSLTLADGCQPRAHPLAFQDMVGEGVGAFPTPKKSLTQNVILVGSTRAWFKVWDAQFFHVSPHIFQRLRYSRGC